MTTYLVRISEEQRKMLLESMDNKIEMQEAGIDFDGGCSTVEREYTAEEDEMADNLWSKLRDLEMEKNPDKVVDFTTPSF